VIHKNKEFGEILAVNDLLLHQLKDRDHDTKDHLTPLDEEQIPDRKLSFFFEEAYEDLN